MLERDINARCLVVWGVWTLAVAIWGAAWLLGSDHLGRLSLIVCGAAVTVTVKQMFVEQRKHLRATITVAQAVRSLR